MPLRKPYRIPRRLNRPTSRYTQQLVARRHRKVSRHKRQQFKSYVARRWAKIGRLVMHEFKFWLIVIAAAVVVLSAIVLLFSPVFDVKQMKILRQDARIDIEEIERTLSPLFSQRLFLVTKAQVAELLESRFPDITEISIEKDYPSTVIIAIHLDRLVAQLDIQQPEDIPSTETGALVPEEGGYAYLTSQGHVVLSPVRLTGDPLPVFKLVDWGIRPAHLSRIVDEDFILAVFEARETLQQNFGLPVEITAIYVRAREFHLQSRGVSFWFDLASPLQNHFDRFREFLRAFSFDDVHQYIDLRLADKVVYQ